MTTSRTSAGMASRTVSASARVRARQSIAPSGLNAASSLRCATSSARSRCRCSTAGMSAGSRLPRWTTRISWPAPASSSTMARPMNRVPPSTITLTRGFLLSGREHCCVRVLVHDQVDQAPLLGLFGVHEEVALHRALDILQRPAGVLCIDAGHCLALAEDLLRMQLDVGSLALDALGERLVDEDLWVWQRHAHAGVSARQQDRGAAGGEPGAQRRDLRAHVLHRVVDGQSRRERSAWAVDVELDVAIRRLALEEEQLRGHCAG